MAAKTTKGLSNIAWIGIGCASLVLIIVVGAAAVTWWGVSRARGLAEEFERNPVAAARWVVERMPEVEEVSIDEDRQTITVRHTPSGEVVTVSFDDIRTGRLSVENERGFRLEVNETGDGTVSLTSEDGSLSFSTGEREDAEFPSWAPVYPGLEVSGRHALNHDRGSSGGYNGTTSDGCDAVAAFFDDALAREGFAVTHTRLAKETARSIMLTAEDDARTRAVIVSLSAEETGTVVALTFNESK